MARKLSIPERETPILLPEPREPTEPELEPEIEPEVERVLINKVSKKLGPSEGNTTLPVEHGSIISMPS